MSKSPGSSPVVVRPAQALDVVNIVKLLRTEWQELAKVGAPPIDEHKAVAWVQLVVREHFVLVADLGGRVVGTIAMKPLEYPWGNGIFLAQLWFFVGQSFRQGSIAQDMLEAAESIADNQGLFSMFRREYAGGLPALFDRRAGYKNTGTFYMRMPDAERMERLGKRA